MRLSDAYRLSLNGGERWADPLGDMIGRVLTQDLNQRLPGRLVFSAAGSLTVDADVSVAIDVQRFDADSANLVTLLAQVAIDRARGSAARTIQLTTQAAGSATPILVAAMSAVLGQLADQTATLLG